MKIAVILILGFFMFPILTFGFGEKPDYLLDPEEKERKKQEILEKTMEQENTASTSQNETQSEEKNEIDDETQSNGSELLESDEMSYDASNNNVKTNLNSEDIKPISSINFATKVKRPRNSLLDTKKVQLCIDFDLPKWEDDFYEILQEIIKDNNGEKYD